MSVTDLKAQIALELYTAIQKLGGKSDLLGIVGSYGDTQPDPVGAQRVAHLECNLSEASLMGNGWTFGSLIANEMRVTAFCQNSRCHHNQQLDLKALAARFGPDTPAMHDDLVPRLKCTKCGGRQIGLTYTPKVRPTGNPYLREKDGW